jgi:hypothetical protein
MPRPMSGQHQVRVLSADCRPKSQGRGLPHWNRGALHPGANSGHRAEPHHRAQASPFSVAATIRSALSAYPWPSSRAELTPALQGIARQPQLQRPRGLLHVQPHARKTGKRTRPFSATGAHFLARRAPKWFSMLVWAWNLADPTTDCAGDRFNRHGNTHFDRL